VVGPAQHRTCLANLFGQNCHFTFKLTPLSSCNGTGANSVFSFKKYGQNHKVKKIKVKSLFANAPCEFVAKAMYKSIRKIVSKG
jgi:hypothetical protein